MHRLGPAMGSVALLCACAQVGCSNHVDVLAGRNDNTRSGANLQETVLTPQLLREGRFGKLWRYDVDGFVYAQPLVVSGVATQFGTRNVLFVATTRDKLYAFDADNNTPKIIWQQELTGAGTLSEVEPLHHLAPSVGILSTPVIDKTTNSIYVVSRSYEGTKHVRKLRQIALDSGAIKKQRQC